MKLLNEHLDAVNDIQDIFYFPKWDNETTWEHKIETLKDLRYLQDVIFQALVLVEEEIFKRIGVGLWKSINT